MEQLELEWWLLRLITDECLCCVCVCDECLRWADGDGGVAYGKRALERLSKMSSRR